MAAELKVAYASGSAIRAILRNPVGLPYQTTTASYVAWNDANRANYLVVLVEQGASGVYLGDVPTGSPAGLYSVEYLVSPYAVANRVAGSSVPYAGTGLEYQSGDSFARIGAPATASIAADIATRAPASTAMDNTVWTGTKAGYLDAAVSTRMATFAYTAPPTAVAVRQEIDANSVGLAAIYARTDVATSTRSTFAGGAVASVVGNVGGNVAGSVGSVTSRVTANAEQWGGVAVTGMPMPTYVQPVGFLAATFPGSVSSYAGGAVASVAGSVGSVTGNVGGSVGSVASYGTLVADIVTGVWGAASRSLTTFGTLAGDTAAAVWSATTRILTAGTNIVLAKGTGLTGLNDIPAGSAMTLTAAYDAAKTAAPAASVNTLLDRLPQAVQFHNGSVSANVTEWLSFPALNYEAGGFQYPLVLNGGDVGGTPPWYYEPPNWYSAEPPGWYAAPPADYQQRGVAVTLPTAAPADWLTAAAVKADAVAKVQAGLATASAVSGVSTQVGVVDGTATTASLNVASLLDRLTSDRAASLDLLDDAVSSRLAAADYEAPSAAPTAAAVAAQVRTELTTELGRLDVAVGTRMATFIYTAPTNPTDYAKSNAAPTWYSAPVDVSDDVQVVLAAVLDVPTAAEVATAWGARVIGNGRTADHFLQGGFNKTVRTANSMVVYGTDDTTIICSATLTQNGSLNPIASADPT